MPKGIRRLATVAALLLAAGVWMRFGAGHPLVQWSVYAVLGLWTAWLALQRAREQLTRRDLDREFPEAFAPDPPETLRPRPETDRER